MKLKQSRRKEIGRFGRDSKLNEGWIWIGSGSKVGLLTLTRNSVGGSNQGRLPHISSTSPGTPVHLQAPETEDFSGNFRKKTTSLKQTRKIEIMRGWLGGFVSELFKNCQMLWKNYWSKGRKLRKKSNWKEDWKVCPTVIKSCSVVPLFPLLPDKESEDRHERQIVARKHNKLLLLKNV